MNTPLKQKPDKSRRVCTRCGKKFKATTARDQTCSLECRRLRKRTYQREYYRTHRICKVCGVKFAQAVKLQNVCSAECWDRQRDTSQ